MSTEKQEVFQKTDPAKPPSVSLGWQNLGVSTGFDPPPATKLRMMVVGPPGAGKSTFIMSRPRCLVISLEGSAKFVSSPRTSWVMPTSPAHYRRIIAKLEEEAKLPNRTYDCIAFDPLDHLLPFLDEELVKLYDSEGNRGLKTITEYGASGKGWSILCNTCQEELQRLTLWGYSWVVITHIVEKTRKTASGMEYTVNRYSLAPSVAQMIVAETDYVLGIMEKEEDYVEKVRKKYTLKGKTMYREESINKTKKYRVLAPGDSSQCPGKKRIEIPSDMELPRLNGWKIFEDAYNKSVEDLRKNENVF